MRVGYARVSTQDQCLDAQIDALKAAGCERIFSDVASGAKASRNGLAEALDYLRDDTDTLVVFKLDRMARSLPHLIEITSQLQKRDIGFHSITEAIDTDTPGGKLLFHMMGAIGEFERDLIRERTRAGLDAARKRGRVCGRPRRMTDAKLAAAKKLLGDGVPVKDVANTIEVSVPTLYRHLPGSSR